MGVRVRDVADACRAAMLIGTGVLNRLKVGIHDGTGQGRCDTGLQIFDQLVPLGDRP